MLRRLGAVGVVGVMGIGVVGRMKALSERFQLDFSKTHVDHVRRGHAHACPSALLER